MVEVLSHAAVGPRRSIVVVRALDRVLVVGVTDGGMTLLTETDDAPAETASGPVASPASAQFGRSLKQRLERLVGEGRGAARTGSEG
jgi:flagellar biogenesis protein FliO